MVWNEWSESVSYTHLIEWKSVEDKYEAIGYLAKPGVIETIEATVPEDKLDKDVYKRQDWY